MNHGAPHHAERHVGDLGNAQTLGGITAVDIQDSVISLYGYAGIIGRAVVVHSGQDGKINVLKSSDC